MRASTSWPTAPSRPLARYEVDTARESICSSNTPHRHAGQEVIGYQWPTKKSKIHNESQLFMMAQKELQQLEQSRCGSWIQLAHIYMPFDELQLPIRPMTTPLLCPIIHMSTAIVPPSSSRWSPTVIWFLKFHKNSYISMYLYWTNAIKKISYPINFGGNIAQTCKHGRQTNLTKRHKGLLIKLFNSIWFQNGALC
jgi:hypothetical protein